MTSDNCAGDESARWLRRWEDDGGTWRILASSPESVTVALPPCDGGEEADRFTSNGPQLRELVAVRGHQSHE